MKRLAKGVLYGVVFCMALLYFFPKAPLFYLFEREIEPFGVNVNEERVTGDFSLQVQNSQWYVKEIKSASIASMTLSPWLFYNTLFLKDINVSSAAASFIPTHVDSVQLNYSVLAPTRVQMEASGEFGTAYGTLSLRSKELNITLLPSSLMSRKYRQSMRLLKRDKSGRYHYDKQF